MLKSPGNQMLDPKIARGSRSIRYITIWPIEIRREMKTKPAREYSTANARRRTIRMIDAYPTLCIGQNASGRRVGGYRHVTGLPPRSKLHQCLTDSPWLLLDAQHVVKLSHH